MKSLRWQGNRASRLQTAEYSVESADRAGEPGWVRGSPGSDRYLTVKLVLPDPLRPFIAPVAVT
jgi:hypothetical protein